jgi:LPS-assembly lipoprotein
MRLGIINGIKPLHDLDPLSRGRLPALLVVVLMLTGCGFHLAGGGRLPVAMQATYLESSEPRSEFHSSLREVLRQRGLVLVESRAEASARLIISEDSTGQRVLSVTARNIPREYEVYYTITFSLEADGAALIEPEVLIARRNYTFDETQVLGKEREETILRRALAEDLARQVVRRIEALTAQQAPG